MADWDDDTPPPLSSIPDQVHAAQLSSSIIGTAGMKEGELKVAATTAPLPTHAKPSQPKAMRRGFLDAKPQRRDSNQAKNSSKQKLEVVKPQQQEQPGQKQIPSMFKLEPSQEQQRLEGMKQQLLNVLQPTPDTIEAVGKDGTLSAGFDDPEVMAAVAEVARDPSAFKKYANNRKVQQFYAAFGNLMGSRLQGLEQQSNGSGSSSNRCSRTASSTYLP